MDRRIVITKPGGMKLIVDSFSVLYLKSFVGILTKAQVNTDKYNIEQWKRTNELGETPIHDLSLFQSN